MEIHIVQETQLIENVVLATAIAALDTAFNAAMDAILAAPPTGFVGGTIRVNSPVSIIFDGTNYICWNTFFYQVEI